MRPARSGLRPRGRDDPRGRSAVRGKCWLAVVQCSRVACPQRASETATSGVISVEDEAAEVWKDPR